VFLRNLSDLLISGHRAISLLAYMIAIRMVVGRIALRTSSGSRGHPCPQADTSLQILLLQILAGIENSLVLDRLRDDVVAFSRYISASL